MGFASKYFEKNQIYPFQIISKIENLSYCIVIPAYNEPYILETLNSISSCTSPRSNFAVIVCLNSNERSVEAVLKQNEESQSEIEEWIKKNNSTRIKYFVTHYKSIPFKFRGAGTARKLAMDEAAHLFNLIDNPNGTIISLDADAKVEKNFLTEIESFYSKNRKVNGAVHYFEHPISGEDFSDEQYEAIINYELYLRYFNLALKFTGFPYAFHTIGSCFSVNVKSYIAHGGMNRQHAGEDFYFIQKVASSGKFAEINSTTVYPSSRISDRVPFGTGPEIKQMLQNKVSEYSVYNFQAFLDLKTFLYQIPFLHQLSSKDIETIFQSFPNSIKQFLNQIEFVSKVNEVIKNTSNQKNFTKRFLNWFNAFKIIKFLNYMHEINYFEKKDVLDSVHKLFHEIKINIDSNNRREILLFLREFEKEGKSQTNLLQQL